MSKNKLTVVGGDEKAANDVIKEKNFFLIYENADDYYDEAADKYISKDKVIEHLNVKGYQFVGPYMIISHQDDSEFIYPMANVSYIKSTVTVKE